MALVRAQGGDALYVPCDVSAPEQCEALVARTVAHFGRLDVACNNAGIGGRAPTPLHETDEDTYELQVGIHLKGVYLGPKIRRP